MPLSKWPDHFDDDNEARGEIVTATFETEMFVAVVTDKAIGLKEDEEKDLEYE